MAYFLDILSEVNKNMNKNHDRMTSCHSHTLAFDSNCILGTILLKLK